MSMKVGIRDLRYNSKTIIDAVERGESVLITRRGKVMARIVPVAGRDSELEQENPFVGMWRDHPEMKDVTKYVRRVRKVQR